MTDRRDVPGHRGGEEYYGVTTLIGTTGSDFTRKDDVTRRPLDDPRLCVAAGRKRGKENRLAGPAAFCYDWAAVEVGWAGRNPISNGLIRSRFTVPLCIKQMSRFTRSVAKADGAALFAALALFARCVCSVGWAQMMTNTISGTIRWSIPLAQSSLSDCVLSSPAIGPDGTIYIGTGYDGHRTIPYMPCPVPGRQTGRSPPMEALDRRPPSHQTARSISVRVMGIFMLYRQAEP